MTYDRFFEHTGILISYQAEDSSADIELTDKVMDSEDEGTPYGHAMDGISSLLLALAAAGVDMDKDKIIEATNTAVGSCANYLYEK